MTLSAGLRLCKVLRLVRDGSCHGSGVAASGEGDGWGVAATLELPLNSRAQGWQGRTRKETSEGPGGPPE